MNHNPPHIFNRRLIAKRRDRMAKQLNTQNIITTTAENLLIESLQEINRPFETVLEIGCHTHAILPYLARNHQMNAALRTDLSYNMAAQSEFPAITADEEQLPLTSKQFNLITSSAYLHWINDLPGALIQLKKTLKPNGLLLANLFGVGTLHELRSVLIETELSETNSSASRMSPLTDVKTIGQLLVRVGFESVITDTQTITFSYPNARTLMMDLRYSGQTNALNGHIHPMRKRQLRQLESIYQSKYPADDGGITAQFEIITLTALASNSDQ